MDALLVSMETADFDWTDEDVAELATLGIQA